MREWNHKSLKAIETFYNGYRFRSRLEAKWAVFMDALGVRWEYESEGFDLGDDEWYLPDFYLPDQDIYVEIKPACKYQNYPDEDVLNKAFKLEHKSNKQVVILCGMPGPIDEEYNVNNSYQGFTGTDINYFWCECPDCGAIGIQFDGRSARNNHSENCQAMTGDKGYNSNSERIIQAWNASRSARFEHGESPRLVWRVKI